MIKLRHFSDKERWGNFSRMSGFALWLIDELRERFGEPFIIHCAFETIGHADNSRHPKGEAIDFHIETEDTLQKQYEKIEKILEDLQVGNRVGLGVYDWGWHIDSRGEKARWARHRSCEYIGIEEFFKLI